MHGLEQDNATNMWAEGTGVVESIVVNITRGDDGRSESRLGTPLWAGLAMLTPAGLIGRDEKTNLAFVS